MTKIIPTNKLKSDIDKFIVDWNNKFPIDRWWRVKHKIPFGSIEHKQANFVQMFLEFREDKMIAKMLDQASNPKTSELSANTEDFMTKEEVDEDFNNLNLENYNDV